MDWIVSQGIMGALPLLIVAFAILVKCADWMVEGAVDLARRLRIPPIMIGLVIVSIGTTAPELAVSVQAALAGKAELALGNAVGSVIYDDGIALPLVALLSPVVVLIDRVVLRSAAVFLVVAHVGAYWMSADGTLSRGEGAVLLAGFFLYLGFAYWEQKHGHPVMTEEVDFDTEPRFLSGLWEYLSAVRGSLKRRRFSPSPLASPMPSSPSSWSPLALPFRRSPPALRRQERARGAWQSAIFSAPTFSTFAGSLVLRRWCRNTVGCCKIL